MNLKFDEKLCVSCHNLNYSIYFTIISIYYFFYYVCRPTCVPYYLFILFISNFIPHNLPFILIECLVKSTM